MENTAERLPPNSAAPEIINSQLAKGSEFRSLSSLTIGETVSIAAITACSAALRMRLLALGLAPGAKVTMTGRAPLRDPIQFNIHSAFSGINSSVSLRAAEAHCIKVIAALQ